MRSPVTEKVIETPQSRDAPGCSDAIAQSSKPTEAVQTFPQIAQDGNPNHNGLAALKTPVENKGLFVHRQRELRRVHQLPQCIPHIRQHAL